MADIEKGENPPNFEWTAPTTNVDGSAINGPLNYRMYRREDDDPMTAEDLFFEVVGTLQEGGVYQAPFPSMPDGRNVIALTAVDADGDESAFSNTLGFEIVKRPNAPTLLA